MATASASSRRPIRRSTVRRLTARTAWSCTTTTCRRTRRRPKLARVSVVIGLTGGIGSGKSTVARMLRELGATVIDADAIVHELQARGMPMVDELAAAFGPGILTADGALDRKVLAAIVFADEAARRRLNDIV